MRLGAMNDPQRPLLDEIAWTADHGFDFVDLRLEAPHAALESTPWREVRAALDERGLGVIAHAAGYLPLSNPSPLVRQAALDEVRRSIDAAQGLGATLCTVRFTGWPAHLSEADGYTFCQQLFGVLIEHGRARGVEVALENGPENQHQLKWFRQIFHRLPTLKLLLDVAHCNLAPSSSLARDYLFALGDRLAHVHLSDNDGTRDAHLPFGVPASGGIDLARTLRDLHSFRYAGTITLQIEGDRRWLLACAELVREMWSNTI